MRRTATALAAGLLILTLAACEPSKVDILEKSEGVTTKRALRDALGQPDDIAKLGPIETWTYKAKNGDVTFVIAGDTVTIKTAGGTE
jgi:hypothetical protein